ncbi:MAG: AAA family ATPase, partial [Lentisphaeria bacterium]|nr:AAA family ATPase [Lentisphaeria bacterium]
MTDASTDELKLIERLLEAHDVLMNEVGKVIYGQHEALEFILVSLLCQGHVLLLGLPGLGKTLMANTISRALALDFCRIQFTPDLMPADITGTDIIDEDPETGRRVREFIPGPVFANLVLADEINRTPPKTQAALLQAMQEHQVSVGRKTYDLAPPFMVIATQNPIEMEGTYVLPEAQLDRFM